MVDLSSARRARSPDLPLVLHGRAASGIAEAVRDGLATHAAVLCRGLGFAHEAAFAEFAHEVCGDLYEDYADLPRAAGLPRLYGSTPYPAGKPILFHNEGAHTPCWPLRQFFHCVQPAERGGETPIADGRRVLDHLSAAHVEKLERLGVTYIRNFTPGLDVSWQEFFGSADRGAVEAHCAELGVECQWKPDGVLCTRYTTDVVRAHPSTGERVLFGQLQLFHPFCLAERERRALGTLYAPDDFPRNACFGNGEPIDDECMADVSRAYDAASVAFTWLPGDVLALDNALVAHGRRPFAGTRKILVAMGLMQRDTSPRLMSAARSA